MAGSFCLLCVLDVMIMEHMTINIQRIYDTAKTDGYRVLVDRLWPRGVSREKAALDEWAKDLAPSADLRTWFGHKPERFKEFAVRYQHELDANADVVKEFVARCKTHKNIVLLYGAKDPQVNHALVLQDYLRKHG